MNIVKYIQCNQSSFTIAKHARKDNNLTTKTRLPITSRNAITSSQHDTVASLLIYYDHYNT